MSEIDSLRIVKTDQLGDWYMAAGNRAYVVGAQDGAFPDLGWHVPGEMGGVWAHPVKLLDGFWLAVDGEWLSGAGRFVSGPFWNAHEYTLPGGLAVERRQFVPDGEAAVVVRYTFRSPAARSLKLRFLARTDLTGVWLSDMDGIREGYDHAAYDEELQAWVCRDDQNPWRVSVGAQGVAPAGHESGRELWGPEQTGGRGISVALDYTLDLPAGGEAVLELVIAGSHTGAAPARESFRRVRENAAALYAAKAVRYEAMLSRSRLQLPDATIGQAWDWVKCNYDWLLRTVPEWGTGLGAGAQDYVWWFGCDSSYAVFGCLALGQHEIATETLDLVRRISVHCNGDSGRVMHEANTAGYVFNPGNTQETPHFVKAVWHTFLWTGDLEFLRRNYDFCKRGLLAWTLGTQCPDGDVLPYGYGIIEVEDLNLQVVDTAVYTVEALHALAGMAGLLGEESVAARSRTLADKVRARLEEAFWMEEEGLYGDMVATPAEMIPRLQTWIRKAEQPDHSGQVRPEAAAHFRLLLAEAQAEPHPGRKRPWQCKNWVVICALEAGLTEPDKAARILARMESPEFAGRWGMYLSGADHSHTMSINTGVLAVAELAYGRVEQALGYIRKITETLQIHMPGAISEMSPDYGCFVQAWSGYGVAWPVVAQVFGLEPDAFRRHLRLTPRFPAAWPGATLKGVRVGQNCFDFVWDGQMLTVTTREPGWTVSAEGVPIRLVQA